MKLVADWRHVAPALLLLALGACASEEPPPPCPVVIAPSDADRLTRFGPRGRDLTDVLFEAVIDDLEISCRYQDGVIEADLIVRIVALRGPADASRLARFDYFVAIATSDRRIIAREEFDVSIPFPGNTTTGGAIEKLTPRIPLQPGQTGEDYSIYVGFDLNRQELDFNRDTRQ